MSEVEAIISANITNPPAPAAPFRFQRRVRNGRPLVAYRFDFRFKLRTAAHGNGPQSDIPSERPRSAFLAYDKFQDLLTLPAAQKHSFRCDYRHETPAAQKQPYRFLNRNGRRPHHPYTAPIDVDNTETLPATSPKLQSAALARPADNIEEEVARTGEEDGDELRASSEFRDEAVLIKVEDEGEGEGETAQQRQDRAAKARPRS
jgi:hypothetical protein